MVSVSYAPRSTPHAPHPLQACLQRSEQVGLKMKQAAFHIFYSTTMTVVYTYHLGAGQY